MKIQMWSDVICPWCTIGRHRLSEALAARPQLRVELVWRPFQLHPDWPRAGLSWEDFTSQHWGSPQRARPVFARIEQVAEADGLHVDFTRIRRVPHTSDAHRVILLAQRSGDPWPTVRALSEGYFTGTVDLGDREQLASLASAAGQGDTARMSAFLAGEELTGDVAAAQDEALRLGVQGVPHVVFPDGQHIRGAQSVGVLVAVLDRAAAQVVGGPGR